jgi:transglutaminase-like putative cysteine protease
MDLPISSVESDIVLTTFRSWADFQVALQKSYDKALQVTPQLKDKAMELTQGTGKQEPDLRALYDFVSKNIHTVDLPLDSTGFRPRGAELILSSDYATPEEKCVLLSALAKSVGLRAQPVPGLTRGLPPPFLQFSVALLSR